MVGEDREALTADTHVHPMGQEMALAIIEEPRTRDQDCTWKCANTYNRDSTLVLLTASLYSSHPL